MDEQTYIDVIFDIAAEKPRESYSVGRGRPAGMNLAEQLLNVVIAPLDAHAYEYVGVSRDGVESPRLGYVAALQWLEGLEEGPSSGLHILWRSDIGYVSNRF